jgi:hypothetical protein
LHGVANVAFLSRESKLFIDTLNLLEPSVIDTSTTTKASDAQEVQYTNWIGSC